VLNQIYYCLQTATNSLCTVFYEYYTVWRVTLRSSML